MFKEGDSFSLTCSAEGYPKPDLTLHFVPENDTNLDHAKVCVCVCVCLCVCVCVCVRERERERVIFSVGDEKLTWAKMKKQKCVYVLGMCMCVSICIEDVLWHYIPHTIHRMVLATTHCYSNYMDIYLCSCLLPVPSLFSSP